MNLTQDDKDYLHETFISRKECGECTARIRDELAEGSTAFATIRQDLQYIKNTLDRKSKFNSNTVSIIIQSVCTLIMTLVAARLM